MDFTMDWKSVHFIMICWDSWIKKRLLFELHIREEGYVRHLLYFFIQCGNCFSIIKSLIVGHAQKSNKSKYILKYTLDYDIYINQPLDAFTLDIFYDKTTCYYWVDSKFKNQLKKRCMIYPMIKNISGSLGLYTLSLYTVYTFFWSNKDCKIKYTFLTQIWFGEYY